jgi:hypothetical protein
LNTPARLVGDLCSRLAVDAGEPLTATAPRGAAYLLLEQPGPWGRKAPSMSHLDRELGTELDARAKAAHVTLLLIRRPGPHADTHESRDRTFLAAHTRAGWLERGTVPDPATLMDLDFAALAAGTRPGLGRAASEPLTLVCTNGRRDRCCALAGRPLVEALGGRLQSDTLWESAHIGGHRFAPTVLLLPSGTVLGRASAEDVLAAHAGHPPLLAYRGRAGHERPAQAAEAYVLRRLGDARPEDLDVDVPIGDGPWTVDVRHRDGRLWRVDVASRSGAGRPESCGREPEPYDAVVVGRAVEG